MRRHTSDDDLCALCERCHALVHKHHNVDRSQNLAEITDRVIASYKPQPRKTTPGRKKPKKPPFRQPKVQRTPEQAAIRANNLRIVAQVKAEQRRREGQPKKGSGSGGGGSNKQAKRLVEIERWKKANGWA